MIAGQSNLDRCANVIYVNHRVVLSYYEIVPTKSLKLNQRVVKFNKLIMHYSMHDNASEGVRIINLEQFVSDEGVQT